MEKDNIPFLLEYLLNIYSVDSYNAKECIFLLLPFKKYFCQFTQIANGHFNELSNLKVYSIRGIAKIILKDRQLLSYYVEYFNYYLFLKEFLDKSLDEIIESIKNSNSDYSLEFYKILKKLIDIKQEQKALEIYIRLESYLNSPVFIELMGSYLTVNKENVATNTNSLCPKYQYIFDNEEGRNFLNDLGRLTQYLEFCSSFIHKVPSEFTPDEYNVLLCICKGIPCNIVNFQNLKRLYSEIHPKHKLTEFIMKSGQISEFYDIIDDESLVSIAHQLNFDEIMKLIREKNHKILLKNINQEIFRDHQCLFLEKCLQFRSFDPCMFDCSPKFDILVEKLFYDDLDTSIAQKNTIVLANHRKEDLSSIFRKMDFSNKVVLSYLLRSGNVYDSELAEKIYNFAISEKDSELISGLCYFVSCHNQFFLSFIDFISENTSLIQHFEPFITQNYEKIESEIHLNLYIKTGSSVSRKVLFDRKFNLVERLLDQNNIDSLVEIIEHMGIEVVLKNHPAIHSIIQMFYPQNFKKASFSFKNDYQQLVSQIILFLLKNIDEEQNINHLFAFRDYLITFRNHDSWHMIKSILFESINDSIIAQKCLNHIIENLEQFDQEDYTLFNRIFCYKNLRFKIDFEKNNLEQDVIASLFDSYISSIDIDSYEIEIIPFIPYICPSLIKYRKKCIVNLIRKFSNLFFIYCDDILKYYPEISLELASIDPKYTIKSICKCFTEQSLVLLQRILETKKITNIKLIEQLVIKFEENLTMLISLNNILGLLSFYIRSFDKTNNDSILRLLTRILDQDPSTFLNILSESHAQNLFLFASFVPDLIENVISEKISISALTYVEKIIESEDLIIGDPLKLCNFLFERREAIGNGFLYSLSKSKKDFIEFIGDVISHMKINSNAEYCIGILDDLVSCCENTSEYNQYILPYVVNFIDSKDPVIAAKSASIIGKLNSNLN